MESVPTKRCIKEIALLEKKFVCLINDHSIKVFYDHETKYIFSKLSRYPFYIPDIAIYDNDLKGKIGVFKL